MRGLRGSCRTGALPAGILSCWCAACAGPVVLVRCLGRRWGWSPQGPRPGDWAGPWAWFSGCGSGWTRESAFVRGRAEDAAFATGSRRQRRSVRPPAHEGRIVGAPGGGVGSASPFSWHGPREGRSTATPDPLIGGSATGQALLRLQIHRWDAQTKNRASTPSATRSPRPRTSTVAKRPVEALAETTSTTRRTGAAPPDRGAAPAQPHPNETHTSAAGRRARRHTDAAAGQTNADPEVTRARRRSP